MTLETDNSYVNSSDIHGLHHLRSSKSTPGKVFWILILSIGFICVTYQIYELVNYFNQDPIVTNVGVIYPEHGMEIPNITICILTKINRTKLSFRYPKINRTLADFAINSAFSAYSTALMDPTFFARQGYNGTALYAVLKKNINGKSLVEFFEDVAFDCDKLFIKCWFQNGAVFSCCDPSAGVVTVKRFLSHNGPCYYFQSQHLYQQMPGPVGGFGFVYNHPSRRDIVPTVFGSYDVHAVYLFSDPAAAMIEKNPVLIPIGAHAHVSMKATKTIRKLHSLSFFGSSGCQTKKLSLFKSYSYERCQVQCMVDTFMSACNCTGLNTYGEIRNQRICPPNEANACFMKLALNFTELLGRCRHLECLEPCEYWSYSHSITLGKVFYPGLEKAQSEYWRIPLDEAENLVMADVYYNEILYTEIMQMSAFTLKELLSSVGGALGLWIGASIITVIDALYYFLFIKCGSVFKKKEIVKTKLMKNHGQLDYMM